MRNHNIRKASAFATKQLAAKLDNVLKKAEAGSTCPKCDQYPYSDVDPMCPVCGGEVLADLEAQESHNEDGSVNEGKI